MKVLLVENNIALAGSISNFLEKEDYLCKVSISNTGNPPEFPTTELLNGLERHEEQRFDRDRSCYCKTDLPGQRF